MKRFYKIIFNPFAIFPALRLILWGLVLTLLGPCAAFYFQARFDGVFDLHFVKNIRIWQPFLDNAVNILCLLTVLGSTAKALNSKSRWVDMLAVVLIARLPLYPLVLFNINGVMIRAAEPFLAMTAQNALNLPEIGAEPLVLMLIFAFFTVSVLVWYIALLYNGFKLSAHAKGARHVIFFVLGLIVCEVLSKFLIHY